MKNIKLIIRGIAAILFLSIPLLGQSQESNTHNLLIGWAMEDITPEDPLSLQG